MAMSNDGINNYYFDKYGDCTTLSCLNSHQVSSHETLKWSDCLARVCSLWSWRCKFLSRSCPVCFQLCCGMIACFVPVEPTLYLYQNNRLFYGSFAGSLYSGLCTCRTYVIWGLCFVCVQLLVCFLFVWIFIFIYIYIFIMCNKKCFIFVLLF